jgi:hypothetical protein
MPNGRMADRLRHW